MKGIVDTFRVTPKTGTLKNGLNEVHGYWLELLGSGELPLWRDFDWLRLPPAVIPWCVVVDVHENPSGFVYRFWGTARTLVHGVDRTGRSVTDAVSPEIAVKVFNEYRLVYEERQPYYFETVLTSDLQPDGLGYHVLRLPFASDTMQVSQILAVGLYQETDIRRIAEFLSRQTA